MNNLDNFFLSPLKINLEKNLACRLWPNFSNFDNTKMHNVL